MIGISIYFQSGLKRNLEVLATAKKYGVDHVFTSLHIPEGNMADYLEEIKQTGKYCKENGIKLCADVSSRTLELFNLKSLKEVEDLGITCFRFDFGFSLEEIVEISKTNEIMINAGVMDRNTLENYKAKGMNFNNVIACHNYYPKIHTGNSRDFLIRVNSLIKEYGIRVMAFIEGDKEKRLPLYEGLPTLEVHRHVSPIIAAAELKYKYLVDDIYVGDVEIEEKWYPYLNDIDNGIIPLPVDIKNTQYKELLLNHVLHNRLDCAEQTIRVNESRSDPKYKLNLSFDGNLQERKTGTIYVSNVDFLRYVNDIEICLVDLEEEKRCNIIGNVLDSYLGLLELVQKLNCFKMIEI